MIAVTIAGAVAVTRTGVERATRSPNEGPAHTRPEDRQYLPASPMRLQGNDYDSSLA
jgi:hypothetical protein